MQVPGSINGNFLLDQKTKIMASWAGPITSWQTDGETMETVADLFIYLFFWAPNLLQMVTTALKLKDTFSLEEKLWPT